jgi:mono/diheme cytochrome c family protein
MGKKRHNFRIGGKRTPVLARGKTATLIVTFKRAGAFAYGSTLAGDAAGGLKGTFKITAPKTAAPVGGGGNASVAAGKQVFQVTGCGSCHVLKSAGASGVVGPSLDESPLSRANVVARVTNGKGAMPAYKGTLTPTEIQQVADFIVETRAK